MEGENGVPGCVRKVRPRSNNKNSNSSNSHYWVTEKLTLIDQERRILRYEIEKVKKRREKRAIEKAQHEEEMAMLARERARAEYQDWEKKEEEFHFEQSKVRSESRLREGRAKPIDVLSKNLNMYEDFDTEVSEPYKT